MAKIFISYTMKDRLWANWIGVTLRDNGHEPFVHEWEIGAGENIPRWMDERIKAADRLLGVFSDTYAKGLYSNSERWAAYWQDPEGRNGFLIPLEIEEVTNWPPLARPLKRLSLVGLDEEEAEKALLEFLEPPKAPDKRPPFPGKGRVTPPTGDQVHVGGGPGTTTSFTERSEPLPQHRPMLPTITVAG